MSQSIEDFAHALLDLNKNETEKAVAYMWYESYHDLTSSFDLNEIIVGATGAGLFRKDVNRTRLAENLRKHHLIRFEKRTKKYMLPGVSLRQLDSEFEPLLDVKRVKVKGALIAPEQFEGTREYLTKLVWEINGCFESGFYDAAAVLLRRLAEGLIVDTFIKQGHEAVIKKPDSSYMMLDDLIGHAKSGKYFRLSRGNDNVLSDIKTIGDISAHNRHHTVKPNEFDPLRLTIGKLLSELLSLSGIKK